MRAAEDNAVRPHSQYPITCAKMAGRPGAGLAVDAFSRDRAV
jgi:hypothetical protein